MQYFLNSPCQLISLGDYSLQILILSFYYSPDLSAGSFRTGALVNALLKQLPDHINIEVITTLPNRYHSFSSEAPEYESSDRLTIHRIQLPPHKSGMLDQAKAFLSFAKKALGLVKHKEYQLVYGTSSRLMTAALSAYIAKNKKVPLYLDIRDIFVDTINDVLSKKLAIFVVPIFKCVEKWTINKAQHVNLVSEGFRQYFVDSYPHQSFSYFTNGIDEEFIGLNDLQRPQKSDTNKKIILYAGNIGEGQGLHKILPDLAPMLNEKFTLRIIGDGGCKPQLQKAISDRNINNIELLEPVDRKTLIQEYQQADILFLHLNNYPAFEKVLPSKVFEYAALSKPILAGVPGYSATFIHKNIDNAAVFPPCNAQNAVEAIASLKLEDINRKAFIEKYSRSNIMQNMAKNIIDSYRNVFQ